VEPHPEVVAAGLEAEQAEASERAHVRWQPWRDDDLLAGYQARDMTLVGVRRHPEEIDPEVGDDSLVATLVRRNKPRHKRAVLYIHGWNDYFFQTHVADWWDTLGYDFYALDLRRYGRSLRTGLMGGYIEDLGEYDLEIDAAVERVARHHGRCGAVRTFDRRPDRGAVGRSSSGGARGARPQLAMDRPAGVGADPCADAADRTECRDTCGDVRPAPS